LMDRVGKPNGEIRGGDLHGRGFFWLGVGIGLVVLSCIILFG